MNRTKPLLFRLGAGAVAIFAVALVVVGFGINTNAPTAESANEDFNGTSDIIVWDSGGSGDISTIADDTASFYCISRTNHDTGTDLIDTFANCNTHTEQGGTGLFDLATTPPSWAALMNEPSLANSSEAADGVVGPPPPPPYSILAPGAGEGSYDDVADTITTTSCFEDLPPPLGPNIVSVVTLDSASTPTTETVLGQSTDRVTQGTVAIHAFEDNNACDTLTPANAAVLTLDIISINATGTKNGDNPNPVTYRSSATDFDGDGCTDTQELDPAITDNGSGITCGDDPHNPDDSFANGSPGDLSGIYSLTARPARADAGTPGVYFYCRADIQHAGDNSVVARPFCYTDTVASDVNSNAYPGVTGDGFSGGPPPGPCTAPADCSADFPNYAFADTDSEHTELTGTYNKTTGNFELSGCFYDVGNDSDLGSVYIDAVVSAHQLPGTVDLYLENFGGNPTGHVIVDDPNQTCSPDASGPTFDDTDLAIVTPNKAKGKGYDQDQDGVSTARELTDSGPCGLSDPYNPYDYYDVSIPRDGVVDLLGDILGVVNNFDPVGYPAGEAGTVGTKENFDRPAPMTSGAGGWSRGAPDGKIDLLIDILGVIGQFNPTTDCRTAP